MAITGIEDRRYWNWIATEFLEWNPILYDEAKRDSFLKVSSSKRRQSKPSLQQEETKQTEFTIESGTNTILCHVFQHECRFKEAVEFMEALAESWPSCSSFMSSIQVKTKYASESSNTNSLQINERANNKRRVSGRKNPANSKALDSIGRPGETCQTEDNIDNKKLVSDVDNAADEKEFVLNAENHIKENVQSKRYCAGRQSASSKISGTSAI